MRITEKTVNPKTKEGRLTLQAEQDEDMYQLYNLIQKGDQLESLTVRNVITESKSGARDKTRVLTKITIRVEEVTFDAAQCSLRVNGVNIKENEHIKIGQYHTLEIEMNRPFSLSKEQWDSISLDLLEELMNPIKKAEVAALVMDGTSAVLCLIQSAMTKTISNIEKGTSSAKNKQGGKGLDKPTQKFYTDIYNSLQNHLNFATIKVVLLGSPNATGDEFLEFALSKSVSDEGPLHKHKSKFVKVRTTTANRAAVEEILGNPEVMGRLTDVKVVDEVRALKTFIELHDSDSHRTCYGLKEVLSANEQLAIENLLIIDTLYRSSNFDERNRYVELIDSVKHSGGRVSKFSSLHISGEQLNNFTGIAAILRFPIYDEADAEHEPMKG